MPKPSKIEQLPKELKELLNRLLKEGRSIDDITEHLNNLGADVSRSGVGRHKQKVDKIKQKLDESRVITEALSDKLGSEVTDNASRVTIEVIRSSVMSILMSKSGELTFKEINSIADSIRSLEQASKISADREIKIKEEIKKEIAEKAKKAAKEVQSEAKSKGLSDEQVKMIKEKFLGIVS